MGTEAPQGELGDGAEEGPGVAAAGEEAGPRGPVASGPGAHRGPAGRQRSPGAQAERAPALGSSPGGCGDKSSELGLRPFLVPTCRACPPFAYSLLQRNPELLVGQRGPWRHGLGGRRRALLCGFEEVVIPGGANGGVGPSTWLCRHVGNPCVLYMGHFIQPSKEPCSTHDRVEPEEVQSQS